MGAIALYLTHTLSTAHTHTHSPLTVPTSTGSIHTQSLNFKVTVV